MSAEVKRKEVELMELRKKQLEMEMEAIKKKIEKQKEEVMESLIKHFNSDKYRVSNVRAIQILRDTLLDYFRPPLPV